jgi:hypothetical protein
VISIPSSLLISTELVVFANPKEVANKKDKAKNKFFIVIII